MTDVTDTITRLKELFSEASSDLPLVERPYMAGMPVRPNLARLIVTAVNALPALLDVAEAARREAAFEKPPFDPHGSEWGDGQDAAFLAVAQRLRVALRKLDAVKP